MSKRSKIVLIIMISLVLVIILSLLDTEDATDDKLGDWEEEIVDPNNKLNPLGNKESEKAFILEIPQKFEGFIGKIFNVIISFFEGLVNKIFVFLW